MSNNKVIGFRSPQQKSISWEMYNTFLRYIYAKDRGATVPISLLYADTEEKVQEVMEFMPMVYKFSAPTGFGKSAISLEPLRWLTAKALGDCPIEEREFPEEAKKLIMENHQLSEDEFYEFLHSAGNIPVSWQSPELAQAFIEHYSPENGTIPVPFSNGAVAAVVRTRSQTQAFLREADRLKAKAIAMPSKASLCLHGRVMSTDSEAIDALQFNGDTSESLRKAALHNIITTTQIDAPQDFFTQDPNILRLVSRCDEQCSKCPMNLKHAKHATSTAISLGGVSGVRADNLMIHAEYGLPEPEEYVRSISEFQMLTKDLEESEILIRQKYPNLCPYPAVRDALPEFNFIVLTYPYVFSPNIALAMSDYLQHVEHILVDEAHNIQTMFQTLASYVYLGEKYYPHVNKAFVEYEAEMDVLAKGKSDPGKKNKLFAASKITETAAITDIQTVVDKFVRERNISLNDKNSIYYLHRALMEENDTISTLTSSAVFQLKDHLDPVVYYFICFFANIQTQYITFWSNLWNRYPSENDIPAGMEINPTDILNILFSPFQGSFKNNDMDESDGVSKPYAIYSHASQNKCAKYRAALGDMPTFVTYFKQLKTWYYSDLFKLLNESADVDVRRASKLMRSVVEAIYVKAENVLKLTGILINNHPEDMSNWRIYQQISNNDFEKVFLDNSIGLMTSEESKSFKNYFLNESVDYDLLNVMVKKYGIDGFEQHQSALFKQKCETFLIKSQGDEDLDISEAYDIFNKLREHCPEAPLHEMPMLRYEGHFPPYMWKLYYRYWEDAFHICPLTLGRLLSNAFGNYKTVGLLSGTFQAPEYLQTFWGVNPYEFEVTETVGKKQIYVIKGLSSKFAEREASYPKFAANAKHMYDNICKRNMLVAAPSTEFMKTLIQYLEQIIDPNLIWPNSRILKGNLPDDSNGNIVLEVNDMLEAVKAASESGVKKIFVTVMGSRFTEGVEYVDQNGQSMLDAIQICGIPFASPDIFQNDQQEYSKGQLGINDMQAFELIQTHAAFQKVRQTIGRGIRSNKDSVVIHLADNRYDSPFWRKHIPADGMQLAATYTPTKWEDEPLPFEDNMDYDDDIPF